MRRLVWWLILLAGIIVFGAIFYNAFLKVRPPPREEPPVATPAAPAPPKEPEIRFPVREEPQEKPLPALGQSDTELRDALGGLWRDQSFVEMLHLQEIIRRVVATIDNLPREKLPRRLLPTRAPAGKFAVSGPDDSLSIDPENAKRYAPYVHLVESVDVKKLIALYVRFYPLFQEAYRDLGYPKGYFNDRLVEVIDHLLATPDVEMPVKLVRPKVFYLFADPEMEARSAGQKLLMRMGTVNAARIKAKLREIRRELTHEPPKQPKESAR